MRYNTLVDYGQLIVLSTSFFSSGPEGSKIRLIYNASNLYYSVEARLPTILYSLLDHTFKKS